MRILFTTLLNFLVLSGFCQDSLIEKTKRDVDAILRKVDAEKDENKRLELLLSIYSTAVEAYPELILATNEKLFEIAEKNNDIITESVGWSFYGQGYRLSGNYIKGLQYHHRAIALAEKSGNKLLLALAQNQIAHIYKDREEFDKAIRLYKSSMDNTHAADDKESFYFSMMNLGAVYLSTNRLDSSLFFSMEALKKGKINNQPQLSYILLNIAGVYSKMGNVKQAESYFQQAVENATRYMSPRYLHFAFVGKAEHFQRIKNLDSSIYYSKQAINVIQHTVFRYLSLKPAKILSDIYENINTDSTMKYLKIYRAVNDTLFNTRANQELQMMTFEEEQRQRQQAEEKISYQNRVRTNLMLAALAVFFLIAFILYRNNLQKQKANEMLLKQKDEIQNTLSKLKSTQAQLIQSEKMASLGELTAGIAHEIQNPLNFVNNFSEVNRELIEEIKGEIEKGNLEGVKVIVNDMKANEEKISHHGKRAEAIVKSMLQHSRASSNKKELININDLADEYVRLAYHGLRAKDKSFNATMNTDFDESIEPIKVVPQDIGRVLLNLINNALYVVDQKKKLSQDGYEPAISVRTKKLNGTIEIGVSDNGNGIQPKILDKIFQPFFTTKPTGQGTGLGLSLSYDIVKAHGGELKVETKEGEGSEFIIQLPNQQ